jgi:hypothetical protein
MGKHHFRVGITGKGIRPPRCLGCKRTVVYGDRCPTCQQKLRHRRKRKPR